MNKRILIQSIAIAALAAMPLGCGRKAESPAPSPSTPASPDKAASAAEPARTANVDKPNVPRDAPSKPIIVPTGPAIPGQTASPATALPAGPPTAAPLFVEKKVRTQNFHNSDKLKRRWSVNVFAGAPEQNDGDYKEWYPNGQLWKEGKYKDDRRDGEWKFWNEFGKLVKTGSYKGGQLIGAWLFFHDDGSRWREENWSEGKRNGTWKDFNDQGDKLLKQREFHDNLPQGTWITWYPSGQKAIEEHYLDGLAHGTQTVWFENGKLKMVVEFRDGKQNGKKTVWNIDGNKVFERMYRDGELVD